jgi:ribosomal protein L11 methylase PrmA
MNESFVFDRYGSITDRRMEFLEWLFPELKSQAVFTTALDVGCEVLSQTKPRSVLDIGSHRGWYSKLAAKLGCKLVAFDSDSACIGKLYEEARAQKKVILCER